MRTISLFFVLALCTISCKKSSHPPILTSPADIAGVAVTIDSLPLKVGYSWTYTAQEQRSNAIGYYQDINTWDYTIVITKETVINNFHVFTVANGSGHASYYIQYNHAVYYYNTINDMDTAGKLDSAYLAIIYPATINNKWYYYDTATKYFYNGVWDSYVKVKTPIGPFDCVKFKYAPNVESGAYPYSYERYYSQKGLIQEICHTVYPAGGPGVGNTLILRVDILKSINF